MSSKLTLAASGPLLLLFLIFSLSSVDAQSTLMPPPAVVVETAGSQTYSSPPQSFSSQANFTWVLSPSDPDQVNGDLNYSIYINDSSAQGWSCLRGCLSSVGAHQPVPDRPGWVYLEADTTTPLPGGLGPIQPGNVDNFTFNITANLGATSSPPSCQVSAFAKINGSHGQCGMPQILRPQGFQARVNQTANASAGGVIDLRWTTSPDDPLRNSTGSFTYRMSQSFIQAGDSEASPFFEIGEDPIGPQDANGQRYYAQTFGSGTGAQPTFQFKIRAEDPATHQWANDTCVASVNVGHLFESNGCGSFNEQTPSSLYVPSGPSFPIVNVSLFAQKTGIDISYVSWLFAAVLLVGFAALGWFAAKEVGVMLGVSGSLVTSATLGLIPLWLLVVIFICLLGVVVLKLSGGDSE